MRVPSRTIWDTRIQCICGVIAATHNGITEVFLSANFGQASLSPPRLIINPNRLYPIEPLVRQAGRFSISLLPASRRDEALRLIRLRRREPDKAAAMGWSLQASPEGIPFLADSPRVLFCELESSLETGDHRVMVCRVLRVQSSPEAMNEAPLLYQAIAGEQAHPFAAFVRKMLDATGAVEMLRRQLRRRRPARPADLPRQTYLEGGQTEAEIAQIAGYGLFDRSRVLRPAAPAIVPKRAAGVCVVGTHWGSFHCEQVRKASPDARLFVCGQDAARTEHLAQSMRADGYFVGIEAAAADPRVHALTLAMPHHLHRVSVEIALAHRKHVLVEKPIATTLQDADAMIAAARAAGSILMVAEDMHFRPAVGMAARRISLGDIGEPLHFLFHTGGVRRPEGWAADKTKSGGGVFMDIGVHYVRALRLLAGEPNSVMAFRPMQINTRIEGEDGLQIVFSNACGWQAHMVTTWAANLGSVPDVIIAGDRGTFHLWPGKPYVDYYPVAPRALLRAIGYVRPYWLQAKLVRPRLQRVRMAVPGGEPTGYPGEFREFLAAVLEDRAPVTGPEDARRDLQIVLRAYDSMESGRAEQIAPFPCVADLGAPYSPVSAP